ncbi:MAG: Rab family GTPase [Promethearchaeota archaeon]
MVDEVVRDEDIEIIYTEGIVFKVIIVGDAEVGKTSMLRRYLRTKFDSRYHTTVGVNIAKQSLTIDGEKVSLLYWDIAGQAQFYMLHAPYFAGSSGIIYAFDLTRPSTLANIKQKWWRSCSEYGVANVPSILVGNKNDLPKKIIRPAALQMANTIGNRPYFETSAKTGENIEDAFNKLIELMMASVRK